MTHTLPRRLVVALTTLAVAAGTAVAVAPTAVAAPVAAAPRVAAVGDLTGDGIADRFSFASVPENPRACGYSLRAGLGGGQFAAPVVGRLPVRDTVPAGEVTVCPGLAVVLKGPTPAQNQLATSFNAIFGPYSGPSGQTFAGFGTGTVRYTGGFTAQGQGDQLLSPADFDGDGYGDILEPAGQSSLDILVGRNGNWHVLYTPPGWADDADLQFLDLNLAGGTDILAVESTFNTDEVAAVVDGRTGARQVLADSTSNPDLSGTTYTLSVVAIDHNRYPDLLLTGRQPQDDGSVTTTTQRFVNQSQGGRWNFRPLARTTAA